MKKKENIEKHKQDFIDSLNLEDSIKKLKESDLKIEKLHKKEIKNLEEQVQKLVKIIKIKGENEIKYEEMLNVLLSKIEGLEAEIELPKILEELRLEDPKGYLEFINSIDKLQ